MTMIDDFTYRRDVPLKLERFGRRHEGEVSITRIAYDNGAGGRASATLIEPARPNGAAVILAHGGTDDGRHFFVEEAITLARTGITALLPATAFPPHGDPQRSATAIHASVVIHRRGLDVLSALSLTMFGFFGHSGGAFQGAYLSAVEPRLSALALASVGSGTIPRLAAGELPAGAAATETYLRVLRSYDVIPYVSVPGRRRLLFQHGRNDRVVLRAEAERAFQAAAPPREWREYACAHDTASHPEARSDRLQFFRW
jgi:pimeloyl-ACP methyl ester carboxylesterase